jgi:hypothetical protein
MGAKVKTFLYFAKLRNKKIDFEPYSRTSSELLSGVKPVLFQKIGNGIGNAFFENIGFGF